MANDLTGQKIQDTYKRVLTVGDDGLMYDGTGSLYTPLSASHEITTEIFAATASFATNFTASGNISASGNINTSGNVIAKGSTSVFQAIDTTSNYVVEILGGGGSGPRLNFGDMDVSTDQFMTFGSYSSINRLDTTNRDFHIYGTNTTTGFYFDESAGRFGIGTTTPSNTLDVVGNITCNGAINAASSNITTIDGGSWE